MRTPIVRIVVLSSLLISSLASAADSQKIGGVDTTKWRGFNLLEKFTLGQNAPYVEDDFRWIAELGFNFVRLPMDYRCYTEKGDWLKFDESRLREIDEAVAFGAKHKIHVCLNLHRAPGFCINPPPEPTDLWTDDDALKTFIAHWTMFAQRYKSIPSERLSFNLLNEPTRNTRETYLKVFCGTIEAIQQTDPNRLILVDGNQVGRDPIPDFLKYKNVIQATRGYHPGTISHYRASWAKGSDKWPEPTWPMLKIGGYLYGTAKPEYKSPLVIQGHFPANTEVAIKVNQLSVKATLVAKADGEIIGQIMLDPKSNPAEWKRTDLEKRYTLHEPAKEMRVAFVTPRAAATFSLENGEGDWLKFSEITIQSPGAQRRSYGTEMSWGRKQNVNQLGAEGQLLPPPGFDPDYPLTEYLRPWLDISEKGAAVFVGEWGCYNKTPHPVTLAWMKSWLEKWKKARFGWALWNFRGSFGILDSGRTDVEYEDWHGHKLDRRMLDLLQQYRTY